MADSRDVFECPICFEEMRDPVTTNCGHSYCMKCINDYWDTNNNEGYSCPQCRQPVTERPVLKKNTLLAALLEDHRDKNSQRAAAEAGGTDAVSGDVACDTCTGRKRKASMFCLVCLASYCEIHLKRHFEVVPPSKKHKVIQAFAGVQESVCKKHNKFMEIYCRTDQQIICLQCVMDEHKGHDTETVAAETREMKIQLDWTKQEIADRLLYLEHEKVKLSKAADSIKGAAWKACDEFEQLCAESTRSYVRFVEKKCSEMREKVGQSEKAGVDWTNSTLGELQREELKLRRREENLNQLSQTENPIQFLQGFQALGDIPDFTVLRQKLKTLTGFVKKGKANMKLIQNQGKEDLFHHSDNKLSIGPWHGKEITSRKKLLKKIVTLVLDPNTVAACLCLSDSNDEISWGRHDQAHPDHPERFTHHYQALCKNALRRSHYWEVEWDGGSVDLAVSYKDIQRKGSGNDSCFGHNTFSWKLTCSSSGCVFWHNNLHKSQIPPAQSRKVGVHLNYQAGTLAFYSVSDHGRLTLLHKIQTTFTGPLYPGFSVDVGSTLKICHI